MYTKGLLFVFKNKYMSLHVDICTTHVCISVWEWEGRFYLISFFFFFYSYFIYLFIYLFNFFDCVGSSVRARAFSSCGKWGPLFIAVRGPLFIAVHGPLTIAAPPVAGHRLQTRRLSSCGSRA